MAEIKRITLDVTPTWEGLLPTLIMMLDSNKEESRKIGMEELEKMARGADAYNKLVDEMPVSDKNSHVITLGDLVDADETDDNLAFAGRVIDFKKNYVVVEDMEGNCFDMEPTKCEVRL